MAQTDSTVDVGYAFESKVAAYYEALGFRIDRNVSLGGHQIDLLVTKYVAGASILSYVIEAKYRESGSIGINEVTPFANTARDLIASGDINGAVMVTNVVYSEKAAGRIVGNKSIKLLTISQLETEIFATSESLLRCCADYERTKIVDEYIPLSGLTGSPRTEVPDMVRYLQEWADGHDSLMTLVGDFGSGKTTVIDRLFYDLAKRRISTGRGPYPIQLRLRSLLSYPSLWSFIYASLRDAQYVTPSQSVFDAMLGAGGFVILLDGFDEIHTGATAADRARYLKRLLPLLTSKSPCIISTRPTYFDSFREMNSLLTSLLEPASKFERLDHLPVDLSRLLQRMEIEKPERLDPRSLANAVTLNALNSDDVRRYLKKFSAQIQKATGRDEDYLIEFLYKIYDLKDLLRRPLLLNMAIVSIVEGGLDITRADATIGPSTLYEMYTQICAKRDASKKGAVPKATQFLSVGERLQGCRELAMAMLRKGAIELQTAEVLDAVDKVPLAKRKATLGMDRRELRERAVTDIRVCSFLSFSDDGVLRFAHKSFFEFFVAQHFLLQLEQKLAAITEFSKYDLSKEVIGFLGSYARDTPAFAHNVEMAFRNKGGDKGDVDSLFYRIALASGVLLERLKLPKGAIADVELRRAAVKGADFGELTLSRLVMADVKASEWSVESCSLTDSGFVSCQFAKSTLGFRGRDVTWNAVMFKDCALRLRGEGWDFEDVVVDGGSIELDAGGRFRSLTIDRVGHLVLGPVLKAEIKSDIRVANSVVYHGAGQGWYDPTANIDITHSILLGLFVDLRDLLATNPDSQRAVRLKDCQGVVVTRNVGRAIPAVGYVRLPHIPGVLIVDLEVLQEGAVALRGPPKRTQPSSEAERKLAAEAAEKRELALRLVKLIEGVECVASRQNSLLGPLAAVFPRRQDDDASLS